MVVIILQITGLSWGLKAISEIFLPYLFIFAIFCKLKRTRASLLPLPWGDIFKNIPLKMFRSRLHEDALMQGKNNHAGEQGM